LSNLRVMSVPIRTNADLRPSRLVKSISSYVKRSLLTIFRVFIIYRPMVLFFWTGTAFMLPGLVIGARFLYFYANAEGEGHIQSVVLASLCITLGTLLYMMGLIADLVATNRKLLERINLRTWHLEMGAGQQARRLFGGSPERPA
jgi:hypothetical protein